MVARSAVHATADLIAQSLRGAAIEFFAHHPEIAVSTIDARVVVWIQHPTHGTYQRFGHYPALDPEDAALNLRDPWQHTEGAGHFDLCWMAGKSLPIGYLDRSSRSTSLVDEAIRGLGWVWTVPLQSDDDVSDFSAAVAYVVLRDGAAMWCEGQSSGVDASTEALGAALDAVARLGAPVLQHVMRREFTDRKTPPDTLEVLRPWSEALESAAHAMLDQDVDPITTWPNYGGIGLIRPLDFNRVGRRWCLRPQPAAVHSDWLLARRVRFLRRSIFGASRASVAGSAPNPTYAAGPTRVVCQTIRATGQPCDQFDPVLATYEGLVPQLIVDCFHEGAHWVRLTLHGRAGEPALTEEVKTDFERQLAAAGLGKVGALLSRLASDCVLWGLALPADVLQEVCRRFLAVLSDDKRQRASGQLGLERINHALQQIIPNKPTAPRRTFPSRELIQIAGTVRAQILALRPMVCLASIRCPINPFRLGGDPDRQTDAVTVCEADDLRWQQAQTGQLRQRSVRHGIEAMARFVGNLGLSAPQEGAPTGGLDAVLLAVGSVQPVRAGTNCRKITSVERQQHHYLYLGTDVVEGVDPHSWAVVAASGARYSVMSSMDVETLRATATELVMSCHPGAPVGEHPAAAAVEIRRWEDKRGELDLADAVMLRPNEVEGQETRLERRCPASSVQLASHPSKLPDLDIDVRRLREVGQRLAGKLAALAEWPRPAEAARQATDTRSLDTASTTLLEADELLGTHLGSALHNAAATQEMQRLVARKLGDCLRIGLSLIATTAPDDGGGVQAWSTGAELLAERLIVRWRAVRASDNVAMAGFAFFADVAVLPDLLRLGAQRQMPALESVRTWIDHCMAAIPTAEIPDTSAPAFEHLPNGGIAILGVAVDASRNLRILAELMAATRSGVWVPLTLGRSAAPRMPDWQKRDQARRKEYQHVREALAHHVHHHGQLDDLVGRIVSADPARAPVATCPSGCGSERHSTSGSSCAVVEALIAKRRGKGGCNEYRLALAPDEIGPELRSPPVDLDAAAEPT